MPTYVAGIQPVLTYSSATFGTAAGVYDTGGYEHTYDTGSEFAPPPLADTLKAAAAASGDIGPQPESVGTGSFGITWDAGGGAPPYHVTILGSANRTAYVLSPFGINPAHLFFGTVQESGGIYWHPEYLPPEQKPENRIGFEWLDEPGVEGNLRVILPADVTITLTQRGENVHSDGTEEGWPFTQFVYHHPTDGGDVEVSSDTWPMTGFEEIRAWTGLIPPTGLWMTSPGLHPGEDIITSDLSVLDILDDRFRAVVWASAFPIVGGGDGPDPLIPKTGDGPAGIMYGDAFTVEDQTWHYQPPPYRWILDSAPVLRHYPRDGDGRGWGGVVRHYPPPRGRRGYGGARQP